MTYEMATIEDVKNLLEDAKRRLDSAVNEDDKEFWREEVKAWGETLRTRTTQSGNDFVTRALGTE